MFGCDAYVLVPETERRKLDSKVKRCILVGYGHDSGVLAYRLYDPATRRFILSRNVSFNEGSTRQAAGEDEAARQTAERELLMLPLEPERSPVKEKDGPAGTPLGPQPLPPMTVDRQPQRPEEPGAAPQDADDTPPQTPREPTPPPLPEPSRRYPDRERKPMGEWWKVSSAHVVFVGGVEPTTVREALDGQDAGDWRDAMTAEMQAMTANKVYSLTELPAGRKAIGCKWVFKIKRAADGSIERYKARIVAKGFSQTEGVDFSETFAPVAKFNSIRTLLAVAAAEGYTVHQMDVKTAFLNGELTEEIYMQQPEGTAEPGAEHLVWRLHRALYGLKQASRVWYKRLDQQLTELGYVHCEADHSVYVQRSTRVLLSAYVDDLMLTGPEAPLQDTKAKLAQSFDMTDLGEAHWLLGMEITRSERGIHLSQSLYIRNVLERFGMSDCKPEATPMQVGVHLTEAMAPQDEAERVEMAKIPYRNAVGSLMYAMVGTRPDIAAAVSAVSRFMSNPGPAHWTAVKRILRYLKGTADWALTLGCEPLQLTGYCDADWGGDHDQRKSTTGYAFSLGSGSIVWSSKRQPTVALSSTEAEYMAMSNAAREAVWLRSLLRELGYEQATSTVLLHSDNQGSIKLAHNPVNHSRTKHIDVQHHFIRELVEQEVVQLQYCPSHVNVADVLTKALPREKHLQFARALGLFG